MRLSAMVVAAAAIVVAAAALALSGCATTGPAMPAGQLGEPQLGDPSPRAMELLAADRAFSDAAAGQPLATALAQMFDDQIIMPLPTGSFATGKIAAVAAINANPANAASKVRWAPVRAGLSADGLQGFTYGFMTIVDEGKPDRRAKYLAYWVKRAEGWRVAAYKRAPSEPGNVSTDIRPPRLPQLLVAETRDPQVIEANRASVIAAEKAFSDRAQIAGLGPAFIEFGASDAMNMGPGPDFAFGNRTIGADMPPGPGSPLFWAADAGALVASSGDLGFTWGYIRPNGAPPPGRSAAIPFFTVWHRATSQDPWRYIAE